MKQIGFITKPQGIKGEFRVSIDATVSLDILKRLKEIKINSVMYTVQKITAKDSFVVFKVAGIDDRNTVETMRNSKIYADFEVQLEEDEVLVSDIIGFSVVAGGVEIGKLKSIEDYGAGEIYIVDGDMEIMFPNVRSVIEDFDMKNKKIMLNNDILQEIRIDN